MAEQNTTTAGARTQNEIWRDRFAEQLDAKVAAVNKANAEANRLQPLFVDAFRPFVGKKILTHGGLAQKPKAIFEQLAQWKADGYKTPSVYQSSSNYSLRFTVKVCVSTASGNGCAYHEADIYVGDLDGYDLKRVADESKDRFALRTDYTAAGVRQLRKNLDEAEKAQREAQSKLYPFNRYDQ
jgi:hypothetical protein